MRNITQNNTKSQTTKIENKKETKNIQKHKLSNWKITKINI